MAEPENAVVECQVDAWVRGAQYRAGQSRGRAGGARQPSRLEGAASQGFGCSSSRTLGLSTIGFGALGVHQ